MTTTLDLIHQICSEVRVVLNLGKNDCGKCALAAYLLDDYAIKKGLDSSVIILDGKAGSHVFNKIEEYYVDITGNQFGLPDISISTERSLNYPSELIEIQFQSSEEENQWWDLWELWQIPYQYIIDEYLKRLEKTVTIS